MHLKYWTHIVNALKWFSQKNVKKWAKTRAYPVWHATHLFLLFLFVEIESRHNRTSNYLKSNAATTVVSCLLSVVKFFYCIFFFFYHQSVSVDHKEEKKHLSLSVLFLGCSFFCKGSSHDVYYKFLYPLLTEALEVFIYNAFHITIYYYYFFTAKFFSRTTQTINL